jgi:hypothetical protein
VRRTDVIDRAKEIERRVAAVRLVKVDLARRGLLHRRDSRGLELGLTQRELDRALGDRQGGTARRQQQYRKRREEVAYGPGE